jgi:hypothetical protein
MHATAFGQNKGDSHVELEFQAFWCPPTVVSFPIHKNKHIQDHQDRQKNIMSLDQCIASLARVERGAIRDSKQDRIHFSQLPPFQTWFDTDSFILLFYAVFSPIPTRPEPYSLNLTQEYSRFSVPSDIKEPGSISSSVSSKAQPRASPLPGQSSSGNNTGDGRFNCGPCKKSFGSEATFHSHQMSAKHIATVKEADKKNKGKGSSKSNASNNNNNARNNKQRGDDEEQQDPPEVVEALASLRKVERIVKENPNMAASVLWKISKGN